MYLGAGHVSALDLSRQIPHLGNSGEWHKMVPQGGTVNENCFGVGDKNVAGCECRRIFESVREIQESLSGSRMELPIVPTQSLRERQEREARHFEPLDRY
jgi:hypothetical protein